MRRFRFQLAGLEKLLAHREDEAKLAAAEAQAERQRAEGIVHHLEALADSTRREHHERRQHGAVAPQEELHYRVYYDRMARTLRQRGKELEQAAEQCETRRQDLRKAAMRRRVLGLLRERRLADHRRSAARDLTRVLDEAGARQFHYGEAGGPGPDRPDS